MKKYQWGYYQTKANTDKMMRDIVDRDMEGSDLAMMVLTSVIVGLVFILSLSL